MVLLGVLKDNTQDAPLVVNLHEERECCFIQGRNVLCVRLHAVRRDRPQARR
jgi:hypothetical protein